MISCIKLPSFLSANFDWDIHSGSQVRFFYPWLIIHFDLLGFEALTQIQNMLENTDLQPSVKESLIVDASNRFFTVIPSIHPHVIRDEDDFKSKVWDTYEILHTFWPITQSIMICLFRLLLEWDKLLLAIQCREEIFICYFGIYLLTIAICS